MPTIDVAMARSLRGGVWGSIRDSLARSIASNLERRDVVDSAKGEASNVQQAFSSWDNCMEVAWCKWPVISVIVIGSIIIFSIIWCVVRCCCCGLSCCCGCCQCLKCCGDCCGCCDPPGTKNKHKNLEDPYSPQPNHGYRSEPPMDPGTSPFAPRATYPENNHNNHYAGAHQTGVTPSKPVAQYAEFDTSKPRGGEDALPEMPSWESAATKKVMVHEDEMEMKNLRKSPAPEQQMGAMHNIPSGRSSPMSHQERNPYNQQPSHYSPINHDGYGHNSNTPLNGHGVSQSYANNIPAVAPIGSGRSTPVNGYGVNKSYGNRPPIAEMESGRATPVELQGSDSYVSMPTHPAKPAQTTYYEAPGDSVYSATLPPHNDSSSQDRYRRATPGPAYGADPYGRQSPAPGPRQTPAPHQDSYGYNQSARLTPAPTTDYAYNQARRTPGPANDFDRVFSPAPDRQYGAASPRPLAGPAPRRMYDNEPPQAVTNNGGFDFNSGHAHAGHAPTTEAYPAYKSYQT